MLTKNYLAIYAKSFNWAGFFLPKKTYEKCSALYDFCREADNIADDENKIEIKKDNFIKFRNNFINKNYDDVIIKNIWDGHCQMPNDMPTGFRETPCPVL